MIKASEPAFAGSSSPTPRATYGEHSELCAAVTNLDPFEVSTFKLTLPLVCTVAAIT